ncbi:unnamed protein product [Urochloa decumbens]|uniref:PGG domain-containing protein n=1 Tax=Urochloa decumbens TaxID=240449 RepID=A0ABC8WIX8_9POAL
MSLEQQEHRAVGVLPIAGADGSWNSINPEEVQNMRLLIDVGGRTIEIPLKGSIVLQQQGSSPAPEAGGAQEAAAAGAAAAAQDADDREHLNNMRGWLMTVATLFVGMAFQGAIHPPIWMPSPKDWSDLVFRGHAFSKHVFSNSTERSEVLLARRASAFLFFNTVTFAVALTLVVVLLLMNKQSAPRRTLGLVTKMTVLLTACVAVNFGFGVSVDRRLMWLVFGTMAAYGLGATLYVRSEYMSHQIIFTSVRERLGILLRRISGRG